ncbi:MAG: hypothetical protein C0404_04180 [Verrucomicrobia bacterium]|nr:hypothetical protein [Verrucomicrobiota bacterium]
MPERMRPREEMQRVGARNVSDDVLIAILLRVGTKGQNVVELARQLVREHGSLTALAGCSVEELAQVKGMGMVKAQIVAAALELGRRLTQETAPLSVVVRTPEDAVRLLRDEARQLDREFFWVIRLDAKNRLKGQPVPVTTGILDSSLVHPREVFREAIKTATAAVVLAHNHPSGDTAPSAEDIRTTRQLVDAGRVVGIKVLDHLIIGKTDVVSGRDYLSLRESGITPFDC